MSKLSVPTLRLVSQQLAGTSFSTPKDLVSWMGAMQAQDYNMVKWAIGIRLPELTGNMVETAINNGEVLRTHVLRPTWHLVAPEDIRWMLELTAPRIKIAARSRDKDLGLTDDTFKRVNTIIRKALEGSRHLTREELSNVLQRAKIDVDSAKMNHFMLRAELDAIVCSGSIHNKKQTYALLDERVPKTKKLSKDEALDKLARRYFTSHSPASLADFVWWSGLSTTEARQAMEMIQADFTAEKINSQTYLFANTNNSSTTADRLHLLPAFDEFIISYKDRTAMLDSDNHSKAISSNGIFRPTIVYNGKVIGLWKKVVKKSTPTVEPNFFQRPSKTVKQLVEDAAARYEAFLTTKS